MATHTPREDVEELLMPSEVARLLRVSRFGVYKLVKRGRLAAIRVSHRALRVRRCDLDRFIRECQVRRPETNTPT